MSYPEEVIVSLLECNGTNCGNPAPSGTLVFDDESPIPEYILDGGDFTYARCKRVELSGGGYTWQLKVRHMNLPCRGVYTFQLEVAADDPVGDYCRYISGQINCSNGKAKIIEAP